MNIVFKILLFFLILLNISFANTKQKVLILHSYHEDFKWTSDINKGITNQLNKYNNIETYIEYMDSKRFVEDEYYNKLFSLYLTKYKNTKFDLIISSDNNAFNFLKKYSQKLFNNTPIVFCGVNYLKEEYLDGFDNFTGVNEKSDLKRNIDLILRLHKNTKNIVVIVDTTTTGNILKKELLQITDNYKNINFRILDNVTTDEIIYDVSTLDKNSIILMTIFFRSKDNIFYEYDEVPKLIAKNTNAPMYGLWDFNINNGIIGGFLTSGYFQGEKAAELGQKILNGKKVKEVPLVFKSPNKYIFDYNKLLEFNINEKILPIESLIINKPQTFYELYKKEIITLIIIFVIMIILIIFLLVNIYQRKKIQTEINKQLKFQQDLIDCVHAPIYYKNKNGVYLGCNKAFEKLFNMSRNNIINKTVFDITSKEMANIHNKKDEELLKSNIPQEYEASHLDDRNLVFHKNVFFNEENIVDGLIGVIFDITELKKITKELNRLNINLEKEVDRRTKQLKVINEELEDSNEELQVTINNLKQTQNQLIESEKMASLGGLVAGVAHEINTPIGISITAISHIIEISKKIEDKYKNEEMTQEDFEDFLNLANNLNKTINTNLIKTAQLVKSFKQISIDQSSEEKRSFNIKQYLEEILLSMTNIIKKHNIKINIYCDDNIVLNSYAGLFSQIFTNLILNSINHGFKDKIEGKIDIKIEKQNDKLKIIYEDDGKGILQENIQKIFEPFFTTNRQNGGTGLGLNVIYNIITNTLKGNIKCQSKENEGVIFIINFPI